MTLTFIRALIDSPHPLEVTEPEANALVLAGLAYRVESHYTMVEASDEARELSAEEIRERLAGMGSA